MGTGRALLTGAGISADPPASLPLGRDLAERLCRCCFEAASQVAPGAVDLHGLAAVSGLRRNMIARLAACAGHSTAADLLRCFRVAVPNEAHLMAAVHAVRGSLHVTLNVDDGVETAYAMLDGRAQLPPGVPEQFHRALDDWRRVARPTAPLRVVASRFGAVDFEHRPLLVKLRGSAQEGWHSSLVPSRPMSDVDARRFTDGQMVALRAAAATSHLAVAGVSGVDTDCRAALLSVLRRGHFSWTSAALDTEMVALVRRIDPSQPKLRPAVEGVRATVPGPDDLPPWPEAPPCAARFDDKFARWRANLPIAAAAYTYAWLLSDAGLHEQAVAVQRALLVRRHYS